MPDHLIISKDKLHKDILSKIRKNHKLQKCPVCRGELTEPTCSSGVLIYQGYQPTRERKKCDKCQIIWELEIFNWTNYRDDDMVIGVGHHLRLKGHSNCFCRQSILEGIVYIENSKGSHSALNYPCPNIDKL